MKLLVDTHTHTVASGHAYSTLKENAEMAFCKGLEGFVCADHGTAIEGCIPPFIITSVLRFIPDEIEGVRLIRGAEANIIDHEGNLDIAEKYLCGTEFAIASMHGVCIEDKGKTKNTEALMGALQNRYINVIGHPGNAHFPIDAEAFVKETARLGKLVEVNNHSFEARHGSYENCAKIIRLCKKYEVRITVSSDAHSCYNMGEFSEAIALLEENRFPEEMIVSATLERFLAYLEEKQPR